MIILSSKVFFWYFSAENTTDGAQQPQAKTTKESYDIDISVQESIAPQPKEVKISIFFHWSKTLLDDNLELKSLFLVFQ